MQEVRRVTTVKKPKKVTTILLVIVGVLGLILISIAIYFFLTGKETKPQQTTKEVLCGCYYLDTVNGAKECTDPRRGFMFQTAKITEGQACPSTCSLSTLSLNQLNSKTEQNQYKSCPLTTISNTNCTEMTIKDKDGKIVTGTISSTDEITVEAKFDNASYTKQQFVINSEPTDPDTISDDKLSIIKKISKLGATLLNIEAKAIAPNGDNVNSITCRRIINIQKETESTVSNLVITTGKESEKFRIISMSMVIGNITETDQLAIDFSFDEKEAKAIKMTKGFTVNASKGELSILGTELYNESNFSNKTNFSQFDTYEGDLVITAKVTNTTKNAEIGSVSGNVKFPTKEEQPEPPQQAPQVEESNFSVSKKSDLQCVERVAPNNQVEYTIVVTNGSKTTQTVNSIKDKLPLGFIYTASSTKINGISVSDQEFVKETTVGDSKEIVWSKQDGWALGSSQNITITFSATAGANAITGSNQNEVVITPAQIPSDPSQLRAESVINVAQDCTNQTTTPTPTQPTQPTAPVQPQTGIFDTTIGKIIFGIIVMIIGWYVYNKPLGRTVVKKLVTSRGFKGMEMTSLKVFKPKKYFEEKAMSNFSRKKK